jgi:hypothetical protein
MVCLTVGLAFTLCIGDVQSFMDVYHGECPGGQYHDQGDNVKK